MSGAARVARSQPSDGASAALAALTGRPDGAPVPPPPGVVDGLDALAAAVRAGAGRLGAELAVDWEPLVTGRAALLGLGRQGPVSANGSCRLLAAQDTWLALNLARPDDVAAVDALVGRAGAADDPWAAVASAALTRPAAALVARARLLGLPAATLGETTATGPCVAQRLWPPVPPPPLAALRVVDLSALWAGPLVAMLLARGGASVTKVESSGRPDAARAVPAVYRWLHPAGQTEVVVDLAAASGRQRLRDLIGAADVVIEASRPRALEQLGLDPASLPARPGRVWCSITGHGRTEPERHWVAFGDDAAVAGGLVAWDGGRPVFLADAVADPVTGLTATAAVLAALAAGGGALLDVSMARSAAALTAGGPTATWRSAVGP